MVSALKDLEYSEYWEAWEGGEGPEAGDSKVARGTKVRPAKIGYGLE